LSLLDDGRVCYRLKRRWASGQTEIVLDPVSFLRRLSYLVPPPRSNLVRYFGAFAAASPLKKRLREQSAEPAPRSDACTHAQTTILSGDDGPSAAVGEEGQAFPRSDPDATTRDDLTPVTPGSLLAAACALTGVATLRQRYLDWASLLRRVFAIDVLRCPGCPNGRLRVLAALSDPRVTEKILAHLGLPTTIPVPAPARGPPDEHELDFDPPIDDDDA
jgi:hypothetical protein